MKVALVIGNYHARGGGAERWTDRFARWLLQRGHEVHLFARTIRGAPPAAVCRPVECGRFAARRRLDFARRAEHLLRNDHFDVVHDMGDGWFADVFMPHHGTRAAGFIRNNSFLPKPLRWSRQLLYHCLPRYREFQTLEKRQYSGEGKIFIALSRMVCGHMRHYYNVHERQIQVVYNGVDVDHFRPATDSTLRVISRKELGFKDETVYLIVAHNFRLKGLDTLLRALAKMRNGCPSGLVVAGNGRIREFRRIAESYGVGDQVRFIGDLPDPRPIYQACDVYVQPTFYDPCSLVVLEAMACGLPVITTKYNGVSEIMSPGREGYVLSDPLDADGLAEYMRSLADPLHRHATARCARQLAEKNSLERNCEQILNLYLQVRPNERAA